jgi:hypothetical protein
MEQQKLSDLSIAAVEEEVSNITGRNGILKK